MGRNYQRRQKDRKPSPDMDHQEASPTEQKAQARIAATYNKAYGRDHRETQTTAIQIHAREVSVTDGMGRGKTITWTEAHKKKMAWSRGCH